MKVRGMYRVVRGVESSRYRDDLLNERLLLHSSAPNNYLGILSRCSHCICSTPNLVITVGV